MSPRLSCRKRGRCQDRDTWKCGFCERNPDRPPVQDYLRTSRGIVELPVTHQDHAPELRDQEDLVVRPGCCATRR